MYICATGLTIALDSVVPVLCCGTANHCRGFIIYTT